MSKLTLTRALSAALCLVAFATIAHAQEAAFTGRITDTSGGVMPGVTVTATNEATGNTFVGITDALGVYRIPVRVGPYTIAAELPGFTTRTRKGVELLVGQEVTLNLEMAPSTVQETLTVTAEAPLVDTTQSKIAGNIDPRQLSELPINGRNWMDLVLLTPGSRSNSVDQAPVDRSRGAYHVNIDGQQVTQILTYGNVNARYSRDAIAEFQFVSNRFDATQGRSSGVQVNAITKSGTNTPSGTFSGYFRDDSMNAADLVRHEVLPYSNQQLSTTFGGPIKRDRIHIFGNYEYEREPFTPVFTSPWPKFNLLFTDTRVQHLATTRADVEFSGNTRLMARYALWRSQNPFHPSYTGGSTFHPSVQIHTAGSNDTFLTSLTKVFGSRMVNELKVGYNNIYFDLLSAIKNPNSKDTVQPGYGSVFIQVAGGYNIGTRTNTPQKNTQEYYSFRDDLSLNFTGHGNHTMKVGGEYLYHYNVLEFCNFCNGQLDATNGTIPNLEALFPVWNDVTTWNINALSPYVRTFRQSVGNMEIISPRDVFGFWVQDDWQITPTLTLNLGARYDLMVGALGEGTELLPFVPADRHADKNNVQPRVGAAYSLNDRTVIRGGAGLYYGDLPNQHDHWLKAWAQQAQVEIPNDGRPDFASNPYNGPQFSKEQIEARYCSVREVTGCLRRAINNQLVNPDAQVAYSYQTSIGLQRQFGQTMSVEADYTWTGGRHESQANLNQNLNLAFNPATGANYPFTDIPRRPYPAYGQVNMTFTEEWSNVHALQTAFTKRMSNNWQAQATYTLSGQWLGNPGYLNLDNTPRASFPVVEDLAGYYALGGGDQRHRAVFNGVWEAGHGFQLSGLYFFGSGQRFQTSYGRDLRGTGLTSGRLRPDGSIVPLFSEVGNPIHRIDTRLQRRFDLPGRATVDGILEVFNLFNHANYASYVADELRSDYLQPVGNENVAYRSRTVQLGFRMAF